jgi:hypothetical protein
MNAFDVGRGTPTGLGQQYGRKEFGFCQPNLFRWFHTLYNCLPIYSCFRPPTLEVLCSTLGKVQSRILAIERHARPGNSRLCDRSM